MDSQKVSELLGHFVMSVEFEWPLLLDILVGHLGEMHRKTANGHLLLLALHSLSLQLSTASKVFPCSAILSLSASCKQGAETHMGGREEEREGRREGGREGGKEGGREGGREGKRRREIRN